MQAELQFEFAIQAKEQLKDDNTKNAIELKKIKELQFKKAEEEEKKQLLQKKEIIEMVHSTEDCAR